MLLPVLATVWPNAEVVSVPWTAPPLLVTVRSDPSPSNSGVSLSFRMSESP